MTLRLKPACLVGILLGSPQALAAPSRLDHPSPPPQHAASNNSTYQLDAELDPQTHVLRGSGVITWQNISVLPKSELYVHLYLNAFKNNATRFMRNRVPGFRGERDLTSWGGIRVTKFFIRQLGVDVWPAQATTPGDPHDDTDIRVPLPREIQPGERLAVDVAWEASLPSLFLRTGYAGSFHMVAQWFPKIARLNENGTFEHFSFERLSEFYSDFSDYDVTVTTPSAFRIGATGELEREIVEDSKTRRRFGAHNVHDFAFAAWDRFNIAERTTAQGVHIECLFPEEHEANAAIELDTAERGLHLMGADYGEYPYRKLTIVHPPKDAREAGGMEYPMLITTGGPWYASRTGVRWIEMLTMHELAHQWFYGLVATNEHNEPFLDEGLTSFAEANAMEQIFPDASFASIAGLNLGLPALHRAGAMQVHHNAPVAQPAAEFLTGQDYFGLVYFQTSTLLRTLGNVYGMDAVVAAVGAYARKYRYGHPSGADFLDEMRTALGDQAASLLRVGLYDRGWVDYVATDIVSESGAHAKPWGGYAVVHRRGTMAFPVDVDLLADDGSAARVRWDGREPSARLSYEGDRPLVGVVVDPEHRILLDSDLTNNAFRTSARPVAWNVFDELLFGAQVLLSAVMP